MLTLDNFVSFTKDEHPPVTLRNFWSPEDGFVWSTGKWCEVTFAFDWAGKGGASSLELFLDVDVFKHAEELEGQNVFTYFNGFRIASSFLTKRVTLMTLVDARHLRPTENILTFDTPDSACPNEYGISDLRILGIQLFSLQIRKAV